MNIEYVDTIMTYVLIIISIITIVYLWYKWNVLGNIDCPGCKSVDSYTDPRGKQNGKCINCDFSETENQMLEREKSEREDQKDTVTT